MRTITIEVHDSGYTVREGDRYHDGLCWDEMLGQLVELTHRKLGETRYPMQTEAQWVAQRERQERSAARRRAEAAARQMNYRQHPTNEK